ncbi:tetratricopeptide repeat protein [Parathalassolituus penaei]|uniref:Tetratricopeptide repeat protein n=1 Tax=Parathalassolituus penaei TaxID=2997323 RepID=A0A9X3ISU7_9GAMM|nr:tetratricopeptide repeat protein [Parathalassolituus penaei]MCY0965615.1 tetratricopeptide repeat protein [Parathalassolituus penaei]
MINNRRSLAWIAVSSCLLASVGCSNVQNRDQGNIADLGYHALKSPSREPLVVTSEDVIKRYQAYLEVVQGQEVEALASRRVAAMRMQKQEAAWMGETNEDVNMDPVQLEASIADYERVLKEFPNQAGNDEVLYQLAKAYTMAGRTDDVVRTVQQLVKEYPLSPYYTDSEFRLGQLLYRQDRYTDAQASFARLQSKGRSGNKYYVNAGYMIGWSLFKQNRYDDSLDAFAKVMDEDFNSQSQIDRAQGVEREILSDTVHAMAVIFTYIGESEEVGKFFDKHGERNYEYLIYAQLADLYYEQKYYQVGATTLTAFTQRHPDSDRAPGYYQQIVSRFDAAGYPLLKRQYAGEYIERFGMNSEYWKNHDEKVRETIKGPLAAYLLDLAKFNHGFAQQSKDKAERARYFADASRWYDEYIRSFPDAADAAEANFLLAEIYYQLGNYKRARDQYMVVVNNYPDSPQAAEAAYAIILAYNRYQPNDGEEAEWRQQAAQYSMSFVRNYPNHPERGQVLVATAEQFLTDHNYQQALEVSRLAWEMRDGLSDEHRYGAALVRGHSAFELGLYPESEQALSDALTYQKIDNKTRQELRDKVAAAIYKQGEEAKASGNYEQAVANWKRIGDVAPGSKNTAIAEYDAATLLLEAGDYAGAENALREFQNKYPRDKLSADIPAKLVYLYEKQGKWKQAANALEEVSREGSRPEEKRIATFQAAEYYEKAGDNKNALLMYKRYANNYQQPFDPLIEAANKLQELYGKDNNAENRRYWLDQIIRLNRNAGPNQTQRSRYLAAGALYESAEDERKIYESIRLTLPLNKSVPVKNKALQDAQAKYTEAVESGVQEYTTASTYQIAQLYTELAQSLLKSERPKGMDDLELEEYQFLLEDQAYPFEEAAVNIHMKNINRTYEGIYDEWVKKSFEVMADLVPTQYRKEEKAVNYVSEIR